MAVGAVVDHVPQDERLLAALLVADHLADVVGQLQAEQVDGGLGDAAEAGGLAVAEDAAPAEALGGLAHGDGLREEHRGVGVVAGGEVLEGDAAEEGVVVAVRLQVGEPVGPDHLQHDRFEVAVGVAVLRVHREDDEVLEAVGPVPRGLEGEQRVQEVGHAEAVGGPAAQVGDEGAVVGGVVREERGDSSTAPMTRSRTRSTVAGDGAPSASKSMDPSLDCQGRISSTASLSTGQAGCSTTRWAVAIAPSVASCTRISVITLPPRENLACLHRSRAGLLPTSGGPEIILRIPMVTAVFPAGYRVGA
ncbi:hypothetical protein SGRI78S_00930 [Streptomyces griseus subsp. griseus]